MDYKSEYSTITAWQKQFHFLVATRYKTIMPCPTSSIRPVSRRITAGRRPKKIFGLAAIDFAKPPAAGRKKIRLSRRFCCRLSRDHNDLHGVKVVIIQQCTL